MSRMTGDGIPGGDGGVDTCGVGGNEAKSRGRLSRALFVSGVFFLSAASVYALSPKGVGPSDRNVSADYGLDVPKGTTGLCALHREQAVLEALKGDAREGARRQASIVDPCRDSDEVVVRQAGSGDAKDGGLETEIRGLVSGYPIEAMVPVIAKFDRPIAALLVGIAKKESDWGNHAPSLSGEDCRNYWGLKGSGSRGTSMGYACFSSPEEAAKATGDRIADLVGKRQTSDPGQLTAWKCGSSCDGFSPESVQSWISGVRTYYDRIAKS